MREREGESHVYHSHVLPQDRRLSNRSDIGLSGTLVMRRRVFVRCVSTFAGETCRDPLHSGETSQFCKFARRCSCCRNIAVNILPSFQTERLKVRTYSFRSLITEVWVFHDPPGINMSQAQGNCGRMPCFLAVDLLGRKLQARW